MYVRPVRITDTNKCIHNHCFCCLESCNVVVNRRSFGGTAMIFLYIHIYVYNSFNALLLLFFTLVVVITYYYFCIILCELWWCVCKILSESSTPIQDRCCCYAPASHYLLLSFRSAFLSLLYAR